MTATRSSIIVGGRRAPTKQALIDELAGALDAPEWFGHNWDALAELLRDRAQAAGLTIDVRAGAAIAPDDPSVLSTLAAIVDELAVEGADITIDIKMGDIKMGDIKMGDIKTGHQ